MKNKIKFIRDGIQSILDGAASFTLWPDRKQIESFERDTASCEEAVAKALASDWRRVGDYMRDAMQSFEKTMKLDEQSGTRKIADVPGKRCYDPQHSPATHSVLEPGVYIHTCPTCRTEVIFTVHGSTL